MLRPPPGMTPAFEEPPRTVEDLTGAAAAAPRDRADSLDTVPDERRRRKETRRLCSQCCATVPITKPAMGTCDGCGEPRYCDEECQQAHWLSEHRYKCAAAVADAAMRAEAVEAAYHNFLLR